MDITNILTELNLDLSNPEVKRGAIDAINAILTSRNSITSDSLNQTNSDNNEVDVELDPDLIQPSQKQPPVSDLEDDIEIEDEENLLGQIKQNNSNEITNDSPKSSKEDDSINSNSEDNQANKSFNTDVDAENSNSKGTKEAEADEEEKLFGGAEETDETDETDEKEETSLPNETEDSEEAMGAEDSEDLEDLDDEEDFLDSELENQYNDLEVDKKIEARKIKKDRTISAAKKALENAKQNNVSEPIIRELEQAIKALEMLKEAKEKTIGTLSDEEFNLLINRVLDAISATGTSNITQVSDREQKIKADEIKQDLTSEKARDELSTEDIEKIRAETQAIKAREKELDTYKRKSRGSFPGFQAFLTSLYRAIALQVHTIESQDSTWSAINRRNNGIGVLKPGKRINELPEAKIPIIDFYFDRSSSWSDEDTKIGMKAVQALAEMEEKGQIKINLYYFGNKVSTDPALVGGGTSAWNDIVENIIATKATNVIIMTDDDMENWWKGPTALKYTVPGYVWYLWKNGQNAPRLPRDLKGRGGTQQFSFTQGDT